MDFSIVIPARNEEKLLPLCLDSIKTSLAKTKASYEIIVVLNRCTDRTEEVAVSNGCRIVTNGSKNLSEIRNAGASQAIGKYLVTVDADSRVSKNMFPKILKTLLSDKYIGGGVLILPERLSLGIICSGLLLAPIAIYYRIQCGLFFLSSQTFKEIGGFDEKLVSAEDIDFARRLRSYGEKNGKKFSMVFSAYLITSCRKFDRFGDWYFVKNLRETISLLKGNNSEAADKIWYDFKR